MNHNIAVMTSSKSTEWGTPQSLLDATPFDYSLDVCASKENAKVDFFYSSNALERPWRGVCWMNPPYGRAIGSWISKAADEAGRGAVVVCLIPNRTETNWFQRIWEEATAICFLAKRVKFEEPGADTGHTAPFANVLAVFGRVGRRHLRQSSCALYAPEEVYEPLEIVATELASLGTTLIPGAGNLWVYRR